LSAVVTRCLEKKPEDRYQTGAELAADLENFSSLPAGKAMSAAASNSPLQRTQAVALDRAPQVAAKASTTIGSSQVIANGRTDCRSANEPARSPAWFRTKTGVALAFLVALVLVEAGILLRPRHHRGSHQRLPGGASIIVNVPQNAAKSTHREASEKRGVQKVQEPERHESERPVSSPSPALPEKVQTSTEQKKVAIYFTSNPVGASIRLDGESDPTWVTPYTIADILPGTHRVVFAKEGYSPEIRDVEIGPRDGSYRVDLAPK
jgi:hypothetical protein